MIKADIKYGLEGAFKVDTYDKQGNLTESTDWFNNFITQTGLMYPYTYSFANCFRFLTIGTNMSNVANYGAQAGHATTGCADPISSFWAAGDQGDHRQDGRWIGHTAYETGELSSACFTQMTDNGPIFFRAWSVPTGGATVSVQEGSLNIGEFMVSPSSGGDPTGRYAFSRIIRPLILKAGYRAVVSYQLRVNIQNAKLSFISGGTFDTGNANISTDEDMVKEWGKLSGYFRQTWCGLSMVDKWGASFITKYGNGMEPSIVDFSNYYIYFSPDNAQFDVDSIYGSTQLNQANAWSTDGTMTPIGFSKRGESLLMSPLTRDLGTSEQQKELFYGKEQVETTVPETETPFNTRLGSEGKPLDTANLYKYNTPIDYSSTDPQFNYQNVTKFVIAQDNTISFANVGGSGIRLDRGNYYHEKAMFSTRLFRLPMDAVSYPQNAYTGRRKNVTRKAVFTPSNALGYNTRYGSMTYAFKVPNASDTANNYTFYPTIDALFYDTSGRSMLQHYRCVSGIYLTARGSGLVSADMDVVFEDDSTAYPMISRWMGFKTIHGPIVNGGFVNSGNFSTIQSGNIYTGAPFGTNPNPAYSTSGNTNYRDPSYHPSSGWGCVYGFNRYVTTGNYTTGFGRFDIGIADHNTGISGDSHIGKLYWPNVYGKKYKVKFSNIVFSGAGGVLAEAGQSDAALAAIGFQRPSGELLSYDAIGISGYRLLPNYAEATLPDEGGITVDTYVPVLGGTYPGFSVDNGLELYFDVIWSSPCGSALECGEPS